MLSVIFQFFMVELFKQTDKIIQVMFALTLYYDR